MIIPRQAVQIGVAVIQAAMSEQAGCNHDTRITEVLNATVNRALSNIWYEILTPRAHYGFDYKFQNFIDACYKQAFKYEIPE